MKLRAEPVCPARGRLVCESSTVRNLEAGSYPVVISWSKKEMVFYLGSERIGVTRL